MRLLVCGGRYFSDEAMMDHWLSGLHPTTICTGGARGAEELASQWAMEHGIPSVTFAADWDTPGRGAGPIRNQRMLDEWKPDVVLAFPGGTGTADMVRRARRAKVRVVEVRNTPQRRMI